MSEPEKRCAKVCGVSRDQHAWVNHPFVQPKPEPQTAPETEQANYLGGRPFVERPPGDRGVAYGGFIRAAPEPQPAGKEPREFVRYEMVRRAEGDSSKPPRFSIYGFRPNGLRVLVDVLYLRNVMAERIATLENALHEAVERERDENIRAMCLLCRLDGPATLDPEHGWIHYFEDELRDCDARHIRTQAWLRAALSGERPAPPKEGL